MAKWEQLIAARECKHFSQMEAAERVNVGLVTYQRWEAGRSRPQPQHLRQLYDVFGSLLDYRDTTHLHDTISHLTPLVLVEEMPIVVSKEEIDEPQAFIAAHLTTHLWSLAFKEHLTHYEKRDVIRQAIKDFDTMNTSNKNYQITRREALRSLAALPMITLGLTTPGKTIQSTQYGNALAHCAASVEACWELRKSNDANDRLLTFQCATKYVSILETIARNSSQYRTDALDLAARYAFIKAFLARHCIGLPEAIQYAKDAIALSKENGDIPLQIGVYIALAWSYFYDKKYLLAEKAAQQAEQILQQSTRLPDTPSLHPQIQGKTYSILAITLAKNGKSPDIALGKAMDIDPGNQEYAFMDFKRSNLLLEAGWTYCHQGDQVNAMKVLEQRIDIKMLAPKIPQSEMGRVETLNVMALSSIKAKNRDMETTIHLWTAGIEGAKALQSEQRFNEALTTYEFMEMVWPGDTHVKDLRDYIVHWE